MYLSLGTPSLGLEAKFKLGFKVWIWGLDLGFRLSVLLLAIVVQPSAHLCDMLQSADE